MKLKIGTAPDSWGVWFANDPRQIPWQRFLDEVVEAGYEWIEIGPYGYLPTDLSTLRTEVQARGLQVCGGMVMDHLEDPAAWPDIERQLLGAGELLAGLGSENLILIDETYREQATGKPVLPARLDDSGWSRLIEAVHTAEDIVGNRFGLKLVFHTHAETHVETEQQIEDFIAQTDPARVHLLLDTGHHAYRNVDPVDFVRRHGDRIAHLHFKSVNPTVMEQVNSQDLSFAQAVGMGAFCEPAVGAVDFVALKDALEEVGFDGPAVVEQDLFPTEFDVPLPIAKRTREYLRQMGFG